MPSREQLYLQAAQEAAALAMAKQWTELSPKGSHGQRCPVYTQGRDQTECDCWILPNARRDALAAIRAAAPIIERQVREKIAAEFEALSPSRDRHAYIYLDEGEQVAG